MTATTRTAARSRPARPRRGRFAFATRPPGHRATVVGAVLLGALWAGVLILRLFVPSTVGLADETDGHRYMCQRGLEAVRPDSYGSLYWHVFTTYQTHTWYGETCGTYRGDETKYSSSFEAVIWLGQQLNHLFGMPGALDLRTLAIIYAILIGLAVGLTFALLPGALWIRLLITIGIGLAYTESVVAVYFVSPYAEGAVWCGFALLLPALLWYWRAPRITWPRLAIVAGLTFFIIAAKTQAAGYLPAIVLALLWKRPAQLAAAATAARGRLARIGRALRLRARSLVVCVLLLAATGAFVMTGGNQTVYAQLNVYEMVFTTLLPEGHDPAADLKWMGADPKLAYASGTTVVSPNGADGDPRLLKFNKDVTEFTVLTFIAAHPFRLIPLTKAGLDAMGHWRPDYLGNYTVDHPGLHHECRDCVYYWLFTPARHTPFWFGFLLVVTVLAGLWLRHVEFIPARHRVMGKVAVFFVVAAVGEFWLIMLTQGVGDAVKHHVFTLLPTMLCVPSLAGCLLLGRRVPESADGEGSAPATGAELAAAASGQQRR